MNFLPISMESFIRMHLECKPSENEQELRMRLESALNDYKNGVKCACGNNIWIVGSAFSGSKCFTCITGESEPNHDFEIDSAVTKRANRKGQRHIDQMNPMEIGGIFDDDGYEINTALIRKPSLCVVCQNDADTNEEVLCSLTRYDQRNADNFVCFAYKKI